MIWCLISLIPEYYHLGGHSILRALRYVVDPRFAFRAVASAAVPAVPGDMSMHTSYNDIIKSLASAKSHHVLEASRW
jgi:hypothetical protein